ncbi:MAG TPA: GNAT family protein [Actinomycetota bacterium]|nr:GNAT family protein [Actinomycetota bacterium]
MTERARVRVVIRGLRADDEAEYLERIRASRRLHRPWAYLADSPDAFRELLVRAAAPSERIYVICRSEDGAMAGIASLSQIFLGNFRSAYLGYSGFAPYDGQGYMTEGLRLVLKEAFGPLELHRVEANIQPENERSVALAERVGFRKEGFSPRYLKIGGRWRDHVRYAILAEEFLERESGRRARRDG